MFFWSGYPFVRIIIAFVLGIVASVFIPGFQLIFSGLCIFLILLLIISSFLKGKLFFRYNWAFGITVAILSFVLGYLRLFEARQTSEPNHLIRKESIIAYTGMVVTQPIQKGVYYRSTIQLNAAKNKQWLPVTGKVNLYVKASNPPFAYGDALLIKGIPQLVNGPLNPQEFNYKRYLSFLNVYHQQFADSLDVKILSHDNANPLIAVSLKVRAYFSNVLERYVHGDKELAIANALLLGNKDQLDDDIKNTYAASGAMHVLAVSGLHVGIIYLMVLFVLKLIPEENRKEWLIAAFSIPLLWGYAFITGLSPSVLRAVTLFSLIAIGNSLGRKSGMANMLAVSAFILLLFDPFLVMQVGFQLSYMAVLGIILIYPQIRKLLMPSSRFFIFLWDVTSISLAAQIATFPLSILYFHRFAPYFMVSNLVVIPAATGMVWLGVLLFCVSWFSMLASWVGWALEIIIRMVNYVLGLIYHLPGSNLDSLYLDIPQTWMLYFIIAGLLLFVIQQKIIWAYATSICMLIFSVLLGYHWALINEAKQITIYDVPHHNAIDFVQAGELAIFQDSALTFMDDKIHFHIKPHRMQMGIDLNGNSMHIPWKQLPYGKVIVWNGVSVLILEKEIKNKPFPIDLILHTSKDSKVELFNKLVTGGHPKIYNLQTNGALMIDLNSTH